MASCYSLASATATTPKLDWIDVCSYSDPTGYSCCPPGMEDKEYLVVPKITTGSATARPAGENISEAATLIGRYPSRYQALIGGHQSVIHFTYSLILSGSTVETRPGWPYWRIERRPRVSTITSSKPMNLHTRGSPSVLWLPSTCPATTCGSTLMAAKGGIQRYKDEIKKDSWHQSIE